MSLQYHEVKEETLRVLEGRLELVAGTDVERLEGRYGREGTSAP